MYEHPDQRLAPLTKQLGLPARASVTDIISAVQKLQREKVDHQRSAATWAETYHRENTKVRDLTKRLEQNAELLRIAHETSNRSEAERQRAMDPNNWRATFTGDDAATGTLFTCLTHGNLVEINGTGQILFHYHPCCDKLSCKCKRLDEHGHCKCHTYPDPSHS